MCGIALSFQVGVSRPEGITRMVDAIGHRGPDDRGTIVDPVGEGRSLSLGHTRLSILDLSDCSAQPIRSRDGRYLLIYNGEVYNYKEIAAQLSADELPPGATGDTGVVLASLIKWGPAALEKFNGMWAFVLYDTREKTLLISRDRFGKKPFYYFQDGEAFYLASEVKSILAASPRAFTINPRVAVPYLTRGLLDFSLETFFEGIQQFPAASYEILDLKAPVRIGTNAKRYWRHPVERGLLPEKGSVTPGEIRDLLIDSVRLRLRSDVPLGVLLSGGLDSSAIVGSIGRLGALDNVTVLSVVSDDPASNEEWFIDAMTRFVGSTTHKVNVSRDPATLFDSLSDACWHNDAPLTAISSLAHMELMRQARARGIKVLLTGQGADEQLGGYNKFFYFYLMGLLRARRFIEAGRTVASFARNSDTLGEFRLSEALRYVGSRRLATRTFIAPRHHAADSLNLGLNGSYARREWMDLTVTSVPALLHSEDRMSMSQSLEMRVPFLDYRLVELFARVDPSEKFAGGRTKSIFREAIAGIVPDEIRYRRDKKGFTVPGSDWLRTDVAARVAGRFAGEMMAERLGFIDRARLVDLYSKFRGGSDALNGRQFFRAFAFEEFLRRFAPSIAA